MKKFHIIKKSRKKSTDIDEKIEYLNRECQKTGLDEGMRTYSVYQGAKIVDNATHTDFAAAAFGGRALGYSGMDGVAINGAKVGDMVASEHGLDPVAHSSILGLKGVAQSPMNPNTSRRSFASTRTGMVDMSPAQPGKYQGTQGAVTGSIIWYWDANANNSNGTQGDWRQLQFFPNSDNTDGYWAVWGSNFLGFSVPRPDLNPSDLNGIINNLQISGKGTIGTPQTTVLTQHRLDNAGFIPIDIKGLSTQGYNYLKGKSLRSMSGGTIYRKAGSGGGGRRKVTSMSGGARAIPYGRDGKVSSRGVRDYVRGRGVGFSPSAGRVAQNVAKELPPEPTPAEIRNETVKQFRENGDNYSANKFYTEDRISELESKPKLTSSEQSELDQLKVNAVYLNENPPEPTPPTPEENNSITNPYNFPPPPGIEIDTDSNSEAVQNGQESKTEFQKMSAAEKKAFMDEQLPTAQVESMDAKSIFEFANTLMSAGGNLLEFVAYNAGIGPEYTSDNPKPVQLPEKDTQQISNIANKYLRENVDPKDWGNLSQEHMSNLNALLNGGNSGVPGWEKIQKDFFGEVIGVPTQATQGVGQDEFRNIFNNLGDPTLFADFIETDANGNSYVTGMKDNYTYTGWDDAKASKTNKFNPYNAAAALIGLSNRSPLDSRRANSPYTYENMDGSLSKTGNMPIKMNFLPPDGVELSDEAKNDLINNYNDNKGPVGKFSGFLEKLGEIAMMEPQDMVKAGIDTIKNLFNKLKNGILDGAKNEEEKNAAKENADKYPPPKQESIFADEDGKVKYYTRSIYTGKDGKTYKEVLSMPWIEPKDGVHDGYFGSLYHPGSYTFKVPLFDTPMDEPLGDYTPPDDLPDIPFTPPEPEPDNRKDYEKNRDRQRRHRHRNSYEPEGNVLSEAVKLGHFEPEALTVNIEKLRKGILPEFPKDPPPKLVNGYSEKSKLLPQKVEGEPFIKVDEKELAKNHRLKDSEIKEFMDEINMINEYIKQNPAELVHAMQRYPKHDVRLAQLNWQMDQRLQASEEYMKSHFPENERLFNKLQAKIKQNIDLTNPKNFKGHKEAPKFVQNDITEQQRRKEIIARHFKKKRKKENKFFS